jgi:thiol-disulfide isomerase/thioredoxin
MYLATIAVRLGHGPARSRLEALEQARLKDPNTSESERLVLRVRAINRSAADHQSEGKAAVLAELEKGVRLLLKEFPKRSEVFAILLDIAESSEGEKATVLLQELVQGPGPEEIKDRAQERLKYWQKKLAPLGKALPLKYTAFDGREVDPAKMRGKVVLVYFWATWCPTCLRVLPEVKALYERLHPKGFEIIGVNFDESRTALARFLAREKLPWPQYFDGQGQESKLGQELGIDLLPTMWLVDKRGIVRDLQAYGGLEQKVEKLLAETL